MENLNQRQLRQDWDELGYLVVRGLVPPQRTQRIREISEKVFQRFLQCNPQTGKPGDANFACMRHLNNSAYFPDNRPELTELLEFGADPRCLGAVRAATGIDPLFRSTSLFYNPSTAMLDGNWHRDSQFLTKTDAEEKAAIARLNTGMQLQIALIASDDSEYVPKSHLRWDTPEEYRLRKSEGGKHSRSNEMPGALRVALQPGDAVAFNPLGLHRGRYHHDKPRRTYMLTYSHPETPWHDQFIMQPWFLEPNYLDGLSEHARAFYQRFIDTFRADWTAAPAAMAMAAN